MGKYEEALERAKKGLPIDEVFPELKESEDERIRKGLLEIFNKAQFGEWGKLKIKDIIAWLEKQKEQKPAEWKPQPESLEALMYAIEGKWEAIKPTSYLSRRLEDLYDGLVNTFNVDESFIAHENDYVSKSAEWSEEDERTLESFLGWLQGSMGEKTYSSWLKSLPERFSPQPKQEWSEEDKTHLCWIIECFDSWKYQVPEFADQYQSAIDWLKSLRPQPHWKPSKEQMRCLLDCVSKAKEIHNASVGGYDAYRILVSLYDELHKLL